MSKTEPTKRLQAYTITSRTNQDGEVKNYWHEIGVGWVNRDGSINVELFAVPVSGKLQLRVPRERSERR
jgi:hypothetical protein